MVHNKKENTINMKFLKKKIKKNVFIYIYKQLEILHVEIWIKKKKINIIKKYIFYN